MVSGFFFRYFTRSVLLKGRLICQYKLIFIAGLFCDRQNLGLEAMTTDPAEYGYDMYVPLTVYRKFKFSFDILPEQNWPVLFFLIIFV